MHGLDRGPLPPSGSACAAYNGFLRNFVEFRELSSPEWTPEEDDQFEAVVAEYLQSVTRHSIPWHLIQSKYFPRRTVWELKFHLQKLWFDIGQILGAVVGPTKGSGGRRKEFVSDYSGMDVDKQEDLDPESNPAMRTIHKFPSCPQLPSHTAYKLNHIPTRTPPSSHPDLPSQVASFQSPKKDENLFFSRAFQSSKLGIDAPLKFQNQGTFLRKTLIAEREKRSQVTMRSQSSTTGKQKARNKITQKPYADWSGFGFS